MNRQQAQRKRDKAIRQLRDLGMSDAEIAQELSVESIVPVDEPETVDAEVVELSNDEPIEKSLGHLPAVIPKVSAQSNEHVGRDWSKSSVPERRCVRIKLNGEQCRNAAIKGSTVCRYHGGAAKHVQAAARARLENATELMAKQLLRMAVDDNVADAVKLSAIKDALDRGGLKAPNEVVLSPGQQSGFDEVFEGIYSGPMIRDGSLNTVDAQSDSSRFYNEPNTAPVDADVYAEHVEQSSSYTDSDRPADRESHERRERRQAQARASQNGSAPITGYDAMHAANQLRALPRGSE